MLSQFSFMLAALLLVIAGVTILMMIEMTGGKKNGREEKRKKKRRVFGYLFFFLFPLFAALILSNAEGFNYQGIMSFWGPVHIVLALLLSAFILVKLFFIKLHVQSDFKFIFTGTLIFGFIFVLIGVTMGYYIFNSSWLRHTSEVKMSWISHEAVSGQRLMGRKCGKCHSLERIFLTCKDEKDWRRTVQRMAELDYPNISSADIEQITTYLIQQQQRRAESRDPRKNGRNLVSRKCGICHDLTRVFRADKTAPEWEKTVDNMIGLLGVSNFLSKREKNDIVVFLASRQGSGLQNGRSGGAKKVEALVARKCSAGCHALDRVLRVEKNSQQWRETVEKMEAMAGDPNFLSKGEKDMIIDWLLYRNRPFSPEKVVHSESSEDVHALISGKCISCHDLEKLFQGRIKGEGSSFGQSK